MSAIDQINQGGTTYEIVPEIAELFSIEKTYRAGDHVIYEAGWYTFKTDKYAGAWDATKVDGPFKVTNELSSLKSDFTTTASKEDMLKAFPTDTALGSVASFADGANVPVKSLIVNIDPVQSGSGDPSPTNVRPISGWSEVNVQRTGKNLLPVPSTLPSNVTYTDGYYVTNLNVTTNSADRVLFGGWNKANAVSLGLKTGTYIWSQTVESINGKKTPTFTVRISAHGTEPYSSWRENTPKTINADDKFFILIYYPTSGEYSAKCGIQIELGSTVTAYEPYQSTPLTISLGQTVYGGKLDVLSGKLVIDYAKITIDGSSTIGQTGSAVSSPVLIQIIPPTQDIAFVDEKTIPRCLCGSYLPPTTAYGIYRNADLGIAINQTESRTPRRIWMRLPEVTTEAQAKTYLTNNPIEVVYPIYNPLTVQLTPHEVTALLGSNNIWADSGDSEVEYRADPTLYINKKIAEAISALS